MQGCLGVASRDDGTLEENGPYKAEEKGPGDMEGGWPWEDRETPREKAVDDEAGTAGRQSSGGLPKSAEDARGELRTAEDARGLPRTAEDGRGCPRTAEDCCHSRSWKSRGRTLHGISEGTSPADTLAADWWPPQA